MEEVKLRPWAKINLYLEVLGRYNNGYHRIRTLIQPITLFDELSLRRTSHGLGVNCEAGDIPDKMILPSSSENIIGKAAQLFFSSINETPSVEISLTKNIPIGGGLGGGSSDAASTLVGLNRLWEQPLENSVLEQLARRLGMDVPCFLEPKPAVCSGRGDIIEERLDNDRKPEFWCVLVNPGKGLSTASVYRAFSLSLTEQRREDNILRYRNLKNSDTAPRSPDAHRGDEGSRCPPKVDILSIISSLNNIQNTINYIKNDLEDTALSLFPELNNIIIQLRNAGVLKSFVCGSGSTVCGIVSNKGDAREAAEKIRANEESKNWWVKVVSTL